MNHAGAWAVGLVLTSVICAAFVVGTVFVRGISDWSPTLAYLWWGGLFCGMAAGVAAAVAAFRSSLPLEAKEFVILFSIPGITLPVWMLVAAVGWATAHST